jgi:hypothetical protein
MRCLAQAQMRLQMFCRRGVAGWRLEEGLRFHLENQIAENIVAGIIAEEARLRRRADLSLGTRLRVPSLSVTAFWAGYRAAGWVRIRGQPCSC